MSFDKFEGFLIALAVFWIIIISFVCGQVSIKNRMKECFVQKSIYLNTCYELIIGYEK